MPIEDRVKKRIEELLEESRQLSVGDNGSDIDESHRDECAAWLASAQNAVRLICELPGTPYRAQADKIAEIEHGWITHCAVGQLAALLQNLLVDAESGLLSSVADGARAETFDDFLDHADAYWRDNRKNESGVIAGVVFEDSLRQICRKAEITERGVKLDGLISELTIRRTFSATKAKRARAAAHVRTKASHAQWDEFDLADVKSAIEFTRELIATKLDR